MCVECVLSPIYLCTARLLFPHINDQRVLIFYFESAQNSQRLKISGPTSNKHLTDINQEVNPGLRKWHRESHSRLKSDNITEYSIRIILHRAIRQRSFLGGVLIFKTKHTSSTRTAQSSTIHAPETTSFQQAGLRGVEGSSSVQV